MFGLFKKNKKKHISNDTIMKNYKKACDESLSPEKRTEAAMAMFGMKKLSPEEDAEVDKILADLEELGIKL